MIGLDTVDEVEARSREAFTGDALGMPMKVTGRSSGKGKGRRWTSSSVLIIKVSL